MSAALTLRWLVFGLAFWGCAELGRFLSFPERDFATFWPASGLYLAALAMSPKRHWGGYILAAIAANALSELLLRGTSPALVVGFCVARALEAMVGAWLLHRLHGRPFRAEKLSDILWMAGVGALGATLVGAAIGGAAVTEALGGKPLWYNVAVWWMSDAVGVLVVAPMLLTFPSQLAWMRPCGPKVWLEAALVGTLLVLASLVAFGPKLGFQRAVPSYPFVVAPFLVWCGLRFGQFGTAVGIFLTGAIAVWGTTRGHGLFAQIEPTLELTSAALQVYLIVVSVTPLMFATVIQQQQLAETRLKHNLELLQSVQFELQTANEALEERVAERTAEMVEVNGQLRREMAERSRAEERLREQQTQLSHAARLSSLGQMAAEMAHELNQPLSAISNYVRGTQRRARAGNMTMDEILPMLEIIAKEANRAAEVIRRTKNFVRKQSTSRTPLDLGAVVQEALALVEHDLRERQVQWEVQLGPSLPRCTGDAVQLQQVIVNLVLNAADALQCVPPERRQVVLAVSARDDSLELSIADSGPGISPPAEERVFDAFFSTKPEGLGLGLPISRGIIESHGGRLWVERGQEGGACLRFTLPVWEGADDDVACADGVRRGR